MFGKASRRTRKRLQKHGRTATATVVQVAGFGPALTRGEGPSREREVVLKATLRVEPGDEAPFEVSGTFRFPKGAVPEEGGKVSVIYDPADHDEVMLEDLVVPEAALGPAIAGTGLGSGRRLDAAQQQDMMQEAQAWLSAYGQGGAGLGGAPGDPVQELERLSLLKQQGAISEAEFEAEKARLLGHG